MRRNTVPLGLFSRRKTVAFLESGEGWGWPIPLHFSPPTRLCGCLAFLSPSFERPHKLSPHSIHPSSSSISPASLVDTGVRGSGRDGGAILRVEGTGPAPPVGAPQAPPEKRGRQDRARACLPACLSEPRPFPSPPTRP